MCKINEENRIAYLYRIRAGKIVNKNKNAEAIQENTNRVYCTAIYNSHGKDHKAEGPEIHWVKHTSLIKY